MKISIVIILAIAMFTTLVGCAESRAQEKMIEEGSSNVSQFSAQSIPENFENEEEQSKSDTNSAHASTIQNIDTSMLSADEKETLRKQAIEFSIHFPYTFETPSKIPTESVGWYTFWKLFERDPTRELHNGYYLLSDDTVNQYVSTHFGMERFVWTEDLPKYDESERLYYFYPVGERPLIEGEISDEEFHDNDTSVTFKIVLYRSAMGTENPQREQIATIDYMFSILSVEEESEVGLQIISAQS